MILTRIRLTLALAICSAVTLSAAADADADREAIARWRHLEYGMFIHFGISTFSEIKYKNDPRIADAPSSLYAPTALDVDQWIRVARDAGMKYAVLTAKHAPGHCLWDSKVQVQGKEFEHDVATSGDPTDVVAAFVAACEKYAVVPGLYYCLLDFHNNPDPKWSADKLPEDYYQLVKNQFIELTTRYPQVGYYWIDIPRAASQDQRRELKALIKQQRPGAVVLYNHGYWVPKAPLTIDKFQAAWPTDILNTELELVIPSGFKPEQTWQGQSYPLGYEHCDTVLNGKWFWQPNLSTKNLRWLYGMYRAVVLEGGGNLLLNVGPDLSGRIPADQVERLMELKQAIDNPQMFADPANHNAKVTASNTYRNEARYAPESAVDNNHATRWATDAGTRAAWLEVDMGEPTTVNRVVIEQAYPRIRVYSVDYRVGDHWRVWHQGESPGMRVDVALESVTAQHFRLNISEATEGPSLHEFQLFMQK